MGIDIVVDVLYRREYKRFLSFGRTPYPGSLCPQAELFRTHLQASGLPHKGNCHVPLVTGVCSHCGPGVHIIFNPHPWHPTSG